jgi:hypothetical protein
VRALVLSAALLFGVVVIGYGVGGVAPAGPPAGAVAPRTPRVAAPGLGPSEQTQLVQAGAFGRHPISVLLLGDSIALTLGIGLAAQSVPKYGVTISNHSTLGCDLDPQLEIETSGKPGPATPGCRDWRALWPFLTAGVHPQVVALGLGRWEVSDHFYEGHWVHVGEKVWDDHVASDLAAAIGIFRLFDARVVLLTMPYIDPGTAQPDGQPWSENTPARARLYNQIVEQVARRDPSEVSVINLNKMLSPHGVYTPVVDGVTMRWSDGIHITPAGGELLQRQILPALDRVGLEVLGARAAAVQRERDKAKAREARKFL